MGGSIPERSWNAAPSFPDDCVSQSGPALLADRAHSARRPPRSEVKTSAPPEIGEGRGSKIAHRSRSPRRDAGDAFVPEPLESGVFIAADDAECLAEEFIAGATSAESVTEEARDELGGPFLTESAPIGDVEEPR